MCRSGKAAHVSPQLAYIEAERLARRYHRKADSGRQVIYRCNLCTGWHITHDEEGAWYRRKWRARPAPVFRWRDYV